MSETGWTEERAKLLRTLWTQGLSASEIARQLRAQTGFSVSRNAVIGKVMRLKLPARASRGHARKGRKVGTTPTLMVKMAPMLKAEPIKSRAPKRNETSVLWAAHKDFQRCAMFCDGESLSAGYVCGKAPVLGGICCSDCSRLAYVPVEPVRRRA